MQFSIINKFVDSLYSFFFWGTCIVVCFLGTIFFTNHHNVSADSRSSSISVELHQNSTSTSIENIEFKPIPKETYTFDLDVTNLSDKMTSFSVYPSYAISSEGGVSYTKVDKSVLINKAYDVTNYMSIRNQETKTDNSFHLEPHGKKIIQVDIKIPEEFEGEMLGGINFSQNLGETESKTGIQTTQVYERVISVRLKGNVIKKIIPQTYGDFKLSNQQDKVILYYTNTNLNGKIIYSDKGTYQLFNPNQEVISEGNLNDKAVLTPFTRSRFSLPLKENSKLTVGKYIFITEVNGEKREHSFEYGKREIEKLTELNDVKNKNVIYEDNRILISLLSGALVILLIMMSLILYKNKKKKKNEK